MILDTLTLHNFGVYGGRQTIDLAPPSPDRPIVLIGGLNGGGKTTLLDALHLALFGERARTSSRNSTPYAEYLSRCVHSRSTYPETSLSLSFRHFADDGAEIRYDICRSWSWNEKGSKDSFREHFTVARNGEPDALSSVNWAARTETLMPAEIAHLFLFDGEQIEAYADPERTSELIESAIMNLLGLNIVDRLEQDLNVFRRKKRTESVEGPELEELKHVEKEAAEAQQRLTNLREEAASLNTQMVRARQQAEQREQDFRAAGGALYERREELEVELRETKETLDGVESELRELAAGALPFGLVGDLFRYAAEVAAKEREEEEAATVLPVLAKRDEEMLAFLSEKKAAKKTIALLESFLNEDRAARECGGEAGQETATPRLGLSGEARIQLEALPHIFKAEHATTSGALERHTSLSVQTATLEEQLAHIPDEEHIAPLLSERAQLAEETTVIEEQQARKHVEVESAEADTERRDTALAKLLESDALARLGRHETTRLAEHSTRTLGTLKTFRQHVIAHNVERIETLVLESFQQLLRKTSLVERISIDPAKFTLSLFAPDGGRIDPKRLSAGERQLLAVSTLWGLAKASGRALPTAIDTPLGRLDGTHREHLVQRYFPNASHQVLLLSTDEEITGEHLRALEPYIGRTYRLDYDDETRSTNIIPGYFPMREAV